MPLLEIVAITLAGVAAGTINAIVGSGTLVTFPTLLMLGYPPLTANISNSLGLLPGGLAGAYGYRRELAGHGALVRRLVPPAVLGGVVGALLLLVLPSSVFAAVVPALVLFGLIMVVAGPRLQRASAARAARAEQAARDELAQQAHQAEPGPAADHAAGHPRRSPAVPTVVFLTGIYGGYFGAAQGIILVGLLSVLLPVGLQSINAVKNVVVPLVNLVSSILFMALRWGEVSWAAVLLIGIGSAVGGLLGSAIGRRLPPAALRGVILVVGLVALARLTIWPA
ncbi:MAG: sulfite exporter TauE/SafE family protein [Austwickia sp.]|nr:sulfite exporter TauE/SafE family protein [Austwickia sp.]